MIDATRVEGLRRERGLSQRELSRAAGITRQAVGSIESGRSQPSVGIALALARALGTTVEELFGAHGEPAPRSNRVVAATIAGKTVTHALNEEHLAIEPTETPVPNVFIAGCELAAGLLSRHAMARSRHLRVLWLTMTNRAAIEALGHGRLHAAVVHGDVTAQQARQIAEFTRFEVARTDAGWLVSRGNPLGLKGAADITRTKARIANRPAGAGARRLLDERLRRAGVDPRAVVGYDREVAGQLDAGRAIAQGFADAAIGMASVARVFDLEFIPVREERCVLLVANAAVRTPEVRTLLDALRSAPFRRDLEGLASYDVSRTGEHIT
ncbi:MAG TPA: substrate-binding domain-containing protein [Candidatus Elarobacter sp.]|nr:substrate-binding domain-containing protein [Candidatus Elarobacter sp.]HEV2739746.1 substrate-binding domain-containing protein [Candidatus Elarobacter sp.]